MIKVFITFRDGKGMMAEVKDNQLKSTMRKLRKQFIKDSDFIKMEIVRE